MGLPFQLVFPAECVEGWGEQSSERSLLRYKTFFGIIYAVVSVKLVKILRK